MNGDERFHKQIQDRERRRVAAEKRNRRRPDSDRWAGLGMLGLVGWAFAVPMLAVLALGIWLDTTLDSPYLWSLMAVFVGAALGGFNAWHWVRHEQKRAERDYGLYSGAEEDTGEDTDVS